MENVEPGNADNYGPNHLGSTRPKALDQRSRERWISAERAYIDCFSSETRTNSPELSKSEKCQKLPIRRISRNVRFPVNKRGGFRLRLIEWG